jgi:hypothetical protein
MPPRRPNLTPHRAATARSFPADSWTPDLIRQAELAADAGQLRWAAELCDALMGDDRVQSARDKLSALFGMPLVFEDGVGRARRKALRCLEAEADWWAAFSDESLAELLWWGVHLGVGIGELIWLEEGGRLTPRLKVWHPRALRQDPATGQWFVRTADGVDVPVVVGDGQWVVFTPKSESMPWQQGSWRAVSRWWRLKRYAMFDWGRACEQAAGLKVASTVDGDDADREKLVDDLVNSGGDVALALPPGWTMTQLAMGASTKDMFDGLITASNTGTAIAYLGVNLTTEVTGGSFAAAGIQADGFLATLRALASSLGNCLRAQVLAPWAHFNFDSDEAAPWPVWQVERQVDPKARGDAALALGAGLNALAKEVPEGFTLDRAAEFERAGFALVPLTAVAPPTPETFAWHLTSGVITPDEARALIFKLGPLPDGLGAKPLAVTPPGGVVGFSAPPGTMRTGDPEPGCGGSARRPFARKIERPITGAQAKPHFDPDNPFWRFHLDRGPDPAICNNVCDDHDGVTRRGDDGFWTTHVPPLHFRCHCFVEQLEGAGHAETPKAALPDATYLPDGFGTGAVPLEPADERAATALETHAEALEIPPEMLGRPPRDGGTGRLYNPELDEVGRVVPRRSVELGVRASGAWPDAWPEWDDASPRDRRLASLLIAALVLLGLAALDELLREQPITPGARRIVDTEAGRLRGAVLTENP